MEDKFIELISEHFGISFFIGVVLVGVVIFLIWWARGVYDKFKSIDKLPCQANSNKIDSHINKHGEVDVTITRIEESINHLEEKVQNIDSLPCHSNIEKLNNHINKHSEVDVAITRIETSINYLQKNIESLSQSLQSNNKGIILDPFTQTHSPLSITQAGREMMNRLGVQEMFLKNWERINQLITDHVEQKNPYDIQQFCLEQAVVFPEKFLNEDNLNTIKLDAYEKGVLLASYMRVIAVLARDKYFQEHNIDVSEVDKNDPNIRE